MPNQPVISVCPLLDQFGHEMLYIYVPIGQTRFIVIGAKRAENSLRAPGAHRDCGLAWLQCAARQRCDHQEDRKHATDKLWQLSLLPANMLEEFLGDDIPDARQRTAVTWMTAVILQI